MNKNVASAIFCGPAILNSKIITLINAPMNSSDKISIYYDGDCPSCIRDRDNYCRLAGNKADNMQWVNISGQEKLLEAQGIDPQKALLELHISVQETDGSKPIILSEMDAYILLMQRTRLLNPVAFIIALPVIKPMLARLYHFLVHRRLSRSGRL